VFIEDRATGSGRFPGGWNSCGGSRGEWSDEPAGFGRLGREVRALQANPFAQETTLLRRAPVLVHPVPHRAVLTGAASLLDAIGVVRRQPGVIGPHRQGLFDRHLTIVGTW
jgi:hypothetical protein